MKIELREAYRPRPIRFLELWLCGDWRLKVYGISYNRDIPRPELVEAAKRIADKYLQTNRTRHTTYGIGFLGIHDGRGENQVFLDRWANENELLHHYWISAVDRPTELVVPETDHNSVCVWELAVQCFEREAWVQTVLSNPSGPDFQGYLSRRLEGSF